MGFCYYELGAEWTKREFDDNFDHNSGDSSNTTNKQITKYANQTNCALYLCCNFISNDQLYYLLYLWYMLENNNLMRL